MTDSIRELKVRAEILHGRVQAGDPAAQRRLRALPNLKRAPEQTLTEFAATAQRRHCLSVIAAELGFADWPHALAVLRGDPDVEDFGTLLSPPRAASHFNLWYRDHAAAAAVRGGRGGYLLAFKRQFFIVERFYIADTLHLDPDDPDWARIGFDWPHPADVEARNRLYAKLVANLPREA